MEVEVNVGDCTVDSLYIDGDLIEKLAGLIDNTEIRQLFEIIATNHFKRKTIRNVEMDLGYIYIDENDLPENSKIEEVEVPVNPIEKNSLHLYRLNKFCNNIHDVGYDPTNDIKALIQEINEVEDYVS